MTDNLRESLSALMDNESEELEIRRLLKNLPEDDELRQSWRSYHMIRDSIHQQVQARPSTDISSRVQAALAEEATPVRTPTGVKHFSNALRYLGQSAIAASVALVVLYTAQNFITPEARVGMEVADTARGDTLPNFSGVFEPAEFTRMARFSDSDIDINTELDQKGVAMDRIRQAVQREFGTGNSSGY